MAGQVKDDLGRMPNIAEWQTAYCRTKSCAGKSVQCCYCGEEVYPGEIYATKTIRPKDRWVTWKAHYDCAPGLGR